MRLFVRDAIDATTHGSQRLGSTLSSPSPNPQATHVMPSYTHLQRAEPVLVAHWLLAYVSMIERDLSRFTDARTRMNFCPLGSGAVAGATLALDRTIAANALAFTAPTPNSMDATSDRDFMLDFAQAASTLGLHISRFAEELTLYATAEFGFVDLPEAFSTGSSAMPQKKNPDLTELARGKSARLLGAATALATLIKGLPLAYNKDLQEGQEQIFDIADTLAGLLSVLPNFTRSLNFNFAAHGSRRNHRLPQRHGRRHLSLQQGRSLPQRARDRRQRRPPRPRNQPRTQRPHPRRTPNSLARLRRRLLRRHHPARHARLPRRPRRHRHRARRRSPRRRQSTTCNLELATRQLFASHRRMPMPDAILVHKARLQDARNIFDLVNSLSGDGTLLRRSYAEICENIRDFTVAETDRRRARVPRLRRAASLRPAPRRGPLHRRQTRAPRARAPAASSSRRSSKRPKSTP